MRQIIFEHDGVFLQGARRPAISRKKYYTRTSEIVKLLSALGLLFSGL